MKIKGNTTYPVLLIEPSLSPIENISMTGYPIYENKITNMEYKMLHNIDPNSSQNHPHLKQAWHNDVKSRIDHLCECGVMVGAFKVEENVSPMKYSPRKESLRKCILFASIQSQLCGDAKRQCVSFEKGSSFYME